MGTSCDELAPALFVEGIRQYNAGDYYECHETLERLWRAERRPIRTLYQGVLQVGVTCYKVFVQHNYQGAVNLLERGLANLSGFPAVCHGFDVEGFRDASRACLAELNRLGPSKFGNLRPEQVPYARFISPRDETADPIGARHEIM